jgi:putative ABC transport system permease protein
MRLFDLIILSAQALRAHLLRTSLTILGVLIGVTSVIAIMSIIEGMNHRVLELMEGMGPSVFIVDKFGLVTSEEEFLKIMKRKDISISDVRALQADCETCVEVGAKAYAGGAALKLGREKLNNVELSGTSANVIRISEYEIADGRFFSPFEEEHSRQVVVIGPTVKKELFADNNPLGKEIRINGLQYEVIGVSEEQGSILGNDLDKIAVIPISTMRKQFGTNQYLTILVKAPSPETMQETIDEVRMIMRARRNVPYKAEDDFGIITSDNFMALYKQITKAVRVTAVAIPAIALVVAGIVVMNIMMVSVTERTREIGIRKSLGARRKHILLQFVLEALLMSLAGGIVGIALGLLTAKTLADAGGLPFVVSTLAVTSGVVVSTGIGVLFGLYPALKGSRLDPVDAMRYE